MLKNKHKSITIRQRAFFLALNKQSPKVKTSANTLPYDWHRNGETPAVCYNASIVNR